MPLGEMTRAPSPNIQTDVRPGTDGPPTPVSVGIFMVDLTEISDPNQTLTGDFAVVLTWTDPRLAHLEGCEISLDDIWSPSPFQFGPAVYEAPEKDCLIPDRHISRIGGQEKVGSQH